MNSLKSLLILWFVICGSSIGALAASTSFTSRSAYDAASTGLGANRSTDFRTRDNGTYFTHPGSDIAVNGLTVRGAVFSSARSYYNEFFYTFPNMDLNIDFPSGSRAFGLDFRGFYQMGGQFTVTLSNGEVFQFQYQSTSTLIFFGVVSETPIQWAKLKFDNDYLVVDNFTFAQGPPPCSQTGQVVNVPGAANPWLSGMPQGSTDAGMDSVPGQSPTFVDSVGVSGGAVLTAVGITTNCPGCVSSTGPDGSISATGHLFGPVNGIGNLVAPVNSLVGVFIDDRQPSVAPAPSGILDFSSPASRDFLSVSPQLKQPFFIGDGLTSTGATQEIIAPPGATRLFLGSMDGFEWVNNGGSFTVTINASCADDEAPISSIISSPPNNAGWNNTDVQVQIEADDGEGSGVKSITYSLAGAQNAGPITQLSDAVTFSVSAEGTTTITFLAEDTAGNVESARTLEIKIDKTAPEITLAVPASTTYLLNASVPAQYICSDSLSGLLNCEGTAANGSGIDTATIGTKTFSVSATDLAGNAATSSSNYSVVYGVIALYDQTKAQKAGGTVPIRLQLVDAAGNNISNPSVVLHAVSVKQTSSQASVAMDDSGNSNPDFDFRYDSSLNGYIFNLKTTGFGTGSYVLNFVAGNSATTYSVGFQVRQ